MPAGDDQVQRARRMPHDLGQQIMNGLTVDELIIVQHQDKVLLNVHQIVEQAAGNPSGRRCSQTTQRIQSVDGHCWKHRVQGLRQIGGEHNQIVVMLVQR